LRVRDAGETKLEFTELPTFGYNVVLVDKQLNTETDLQRTPAYTFVVAKRGVNAVELNDRFSLRLEYTGRGVVTGVANIETPALQVFSQDGYIHVRSSAGAINHLQIYNLAGASVYTSQTSAEQFKVKVSGSHLYIVKARIGDEYKTEKIMVK
jgi:hypothetical protein